MKHIRSPLTPISLLVLAIALAASASPQQELYTYYFYVSSHATGQLALTLTGLKDNTQATLYMLTSQGLSAQPIYTAELNQLETAVVTGLSPGVYKLTATSRVAAILGPPNPQEIGGVDSAVAYTAANGLPAGKEYVFKLYHHRTNLHIIAYEDARVEIRSLRGTLLKTLKLRQNQTTALFLPIAQVYHVTSTGRISIQHMGIECINFLASPRGLYKDTVFLGYYDNHDVLTWIAVFPYQPCRVTITDTANGAVLWEHQFTQKEVEGYKPVWLKPAGITVKIESDKPITVLLASGGGAYYFFERTKGVAQATIPANQTFKFYIPPNTAPASDAMIFAISNCKATLDGTPLEFGAGQYLEIPPGLHQIKSDKPLILQVYYSGGARDATALISDKDAGKKLQPPRPSTEIAGENPDVISPILAAAILAAVALIAIKLRRPGIRRPKS